MDSRARRRAWIYGWVSMVLGLGFLLLRGSAWEGSTQLHTLMEALATVLALTVGVMALVRFYSRKSNTFLFIGAGFLGTALLDGYHGIITSTFYAEAGIFPSPPASLIPWSWLASRLFLSVLLWLSWLAWRREERLGPAGKISERAIYVTVVGLTLASFLVFAFVPLPAAYRSRGFFPRPQELVPAVFFLLALVGYLRQGRWRQATFEHWLVLALIVSFLGQALFISTSHRLFDAAFDAAHLLKKTSYVLVLTGLVASMYRLFRQAEDSTLAIRATHGALVQEMAGREAAVAALRLEQQRLQALLKLNEMTEASLRQVTDFALEEGVRLTGSTIGYLAFLNEDESVLTMHSWSKTAMKECAIMDKPLVYPVATTGLWGEAVRQRQPVITNDYAAPNPLKKGHPAGHVAVVRHMNVPVFDGARIVAVAGVGNKEAPYDESDVVQLRLLMTGMWRLIQRRQSQEALRALNETLEKRVAERTALAEQRARELERSNAELEQFAYVVSHDLQEPLRMVSSFTSLLARRYGGRLDSQADEFIQFTVDGAARMRTLINDLLAYSRVGRADKPLTDTDCETVLQEVLANLQVALSESGAEISHDPLPHVLGDRVQLTRLFQNLLSNAIKFHGEIPVHVHIGVHRQNGAWRLSVQDNGIGIPADQFSRLFLIFQRLHDPAKYPGSGIGLAVCKKIVERHGGQIWAESEPGRGTTFYFTLPADQAAGPTARA